MADGQSEYLTGVASTSPIFPTGYTPVYSNDAFGLLGLALESIKGDTFRSLFDTHLVQQLGLSGTHYSLPDTYENALIPGDPTLTNWDSIFGPFAG